MRPKLDLIFSFKAITQDYSSLLLTVFTMISILLSCFEYFLSSKLVSFSSTIIISFDIESHDIVAMSHPQFESKIIFRQHKAIASLAKLLSVRFSQAERKTNIKWYNVYIYDCC